MFRPLDNGASVPLNAAGQPDYRLLSYPLAVPVRLADAQAGGAGWPDPGFPADVDPRIRATALKETLQAPAIWGGWLLLAGLAVALWATRRG